MIYTIDNYKQLLKTDHISVGDHILFYVDGKVFEYQVRDTWIEPINKAQYPTETVIFDYLKDLGLIPEFDNIGAYCEHIYGYLITKINPGVWPDFVIQNRTNVVSKLIEDLFTRIELGIKPVSKLNLIDIDCEL